MVRLKWFHQTNWFFPFYHQEWIDWQERVAHYYNNISKDFSPHLKSGVGNKEIAYRSRPQCVLKTITSKNEIGVYFKAVLVEDFQICVWSIETLHVNNNLKKKELNWIWICGNILFQYIRRPCSVGSWFGFYISLYDHISCITLFIHIWSKVFLIFFCLSLK